MATTIEGTQHQWAHVAAIVKEFREAMGLTQAETVERAGGMLSVPVLQNIEGAKKLRYRRRSLIGAARALGWTDDSIERALKGGEPLLRASVYGGDELSEAFDAVRTALDRLQSVLVERGAPGFGVSER